MRKCEGSHGGEDANAPEGDPSGLAVSPPAGRVLPLAPLVMRWIIRMVRKGASGASGASGTRTRLGYCLLCLAAAAALTPSAGPAQATEAAGAARVIDLTYDVYLGGFHIFSFDVDMTLQADRYRVLAEGETRGMVDLLYAWDVKAVAEGSDLGGRIAPDSYVVESAWQSEQRSLELGFAGEGRYELRRDPPPEPDPEVDSRLPETLPPEIVDPLSLAIAASRAVARNGSCEQTLPVFDGQRRYDVFLRQVGPAILPPNEYALYDGPALRCSFRVERISGFRKTPRADRKPAAAPPILWLAEIGQDLPPLPVRYEGEIALGSIVVHLTGAEVRDAPGDLGSAE